MDDYSTHMLDMAQATHKATDYLRASQSLGPLAKTVALLNAESRLMEAITAARLAMACIRGMHTSYGGTD